MYDSPPYRSGILFSFDYKCSKFYEVIISLLTSGISFYFIRDLASNLKLFIKLANF